MNSETIKRYNRLQRYARKHGMLLKMEDGSAILYKVLEETFMVSTPADLDKIAETIGMSIPAAELPRKNL